MSLKAKHEIKVTELIKERLFLLSKCQSDLELRRYCIARSRLDPIWFCNMFLTTFNPREHPSIIPFILYGKQEELIDWMNQRLALKEWGVLEKSRYIGASVICCAFLLHKWLFEFNMAGSIASRKADLVDKIGNPDCLMEKIVMMLNRLPKWMIPKHERKLMLLKNLENGSVIRGESGSENIGRGGRSTLVVVDEAAFVENSTLMVNALSENSDCCIFVSTPNGMAGEFARMRFCGAYPIFTYHWSSDPRRAESDFYEKMKERFSAATVAQELDISYNASIEGTAIPSIHVRASVNASNLFPQMKIAARQYSAGLDIATTGKNRTVLVIRRGVIVEEVISWQDLDTTQTAFKVDRILKDKGIKHLTFDVCGLGQGVAGTLNSMMPLPYTVEPLNAAGCPSNKIWNAEDRTAQEKFLNRRSEMWGDIRERFRKTWEMVEGIKQHPLEELISIPEHPSLISELSQPLLKYNAAGKEVLESKDSMKARGIESPDFADACVMSFQGVVDFSWMSM